MHTPITQYPSFLTIFLPFLLSFLCALAISKLGPRISLVDTPNSRSSHLTPTPRGGGVGIWLSFLIVPFFLFLPLPSLLAPVPSHYTTHSSFLPEFILVAGLLGLLGLLEDRFNISPKLRLLLQLALSAMAVHLFIAPFTLHASPCILLLSLFFFFFWIVFIAGTANFYNFMDGINGIAGLTGAVGFGLMAFFSYSIINNYEVALLSFVLMGGCLGFLPLNFPRARTFMGDVGSIFLGFVFASFVADLSCNGSVFLCLCMFLCPFYSDALMTIYYRWRMGENLMQAHRSHLYQYLSNELAIPHWKVSLLYALMQLVMGVLAIFAYKAGMFWQILLVIVFSIIYIFCYRSIVPHSVFTVRFLSKNRIYEQEHVTP